MKYYQRETKEILEELGCDPTRGLDRGDVSTRREQYGTNELVELGQRGPWKILYEQLQGAMVLLLVAAAAVSVALEEYKDALAIAAIVLLNTALGFFQDFRAEKAIAALKKLSRPTARVRRDGSEISVEPKELVPGDILLLEAGNIVPADARLLHCPRLKTQESALTGESEPVEKAASALPSGDVALGEQQNMVFMGTSVLIGRGEAVVTATGMRTQIGNIAHLLQGVGRDPTPLQRRLGRLGRNLAALALVIVAVVFALGVLRGEDAQLMILTAMSLAVAAVPEGLPAVATVALATGARRMLERRALIRKLPAVETLGSVTVVCSDKTGTLTQNRMTVAEALVPGANPCESPALLLAAASLCNDAQLSPPSPDGERVAEGDPTESALLVAASHCGLERSDLENAIPRVSEQPFDADRKRMSTIHERGDLSTIQPQVIDALQKQPGFEDQDIRIAFTKGAVDRMVDVCRSIYIAGKVETLDRVKRDDVLATNERLASSGMRVLGVALKLVTARDDSKLEEGMTYLGTIGLIDPPRPEAKTAVESCKKAGIRPVMITGDHPLTAAHIAQSLGIDAGSQVLTGDEIERLSPSDLDRSVLDVSVYARVTPEHKLRIVEALQRHGQVVAMTGDGVNDAPSLKRADIGVAMGITGTDVSKEAADMVLTDDNFATIVSAVYEGRTIYDNIRKFVKYTMTSNAGEIWVMLLAPLFGMPLPLLPLQILWVNLVTDGLPGLALALEPAEPHTLERPPIPPNEGFFARGMGRDLLWIGLLMGLLSLAVGGAYWSPDSSNDPYWRTALFTVLTLSQMGNALAIRTERESVFRVGLLTNKPILGAILLTFALQLAVIYVPFLQEIFETTALSVIDLVLCLVASTVVFWGVELSKLLRRRRENGRTSGT